MCNCNCNYETANNGRCCNYTLYDSTWTSIEEALRTAECAAYNANAAACQAAEYATEATAARDQVQCLVNQYNACNNRCENCCCCNCCRN